MDVTWNDVYEYYERDAFGNATFHHRFPQFAGNGVPGSAFASTFDGDKGGRITSSLEEWTYDPEPNEPSGWDPGSKTCYYESDRGDQIAVWSETYGWAFSGTGGNEYKTAELETEHRSYSRSYHSADGQLRVHQVNRDSLDYRNYEYPDWTIGYGDPWGVYEEYWYDALGRRILKRIRQTSSICSHQDRCQSAIERYVWDGDQILWEVRGTGSLDDDDPTGSAYTGQTGNVGYVHGHRIDAPLGMVRNGAAIFLQTNWKGEYTSAADTAGSAVANDVAWPGYEWTVGGRRIDPWEVHTWVGSLPLGQQDQTGMTYRRNRYYDPESGQFTQQDPIGIAGGLNLYGYANGDPVNFSDPFGLCPEEEEEGSLCLDFFISEEVAGFFFRGDGRDFDPNAGREESRIQIVISPDGSVNTHVSDSCSRVGCAPPSSRNRIGVDAGDDGSYTVTVEAYNSAAGRGVPAINASITLNPDGNGGFRTSGARDGYPSLGIYQQRGGSWIQLPGGARPEQTPWSLWPPLDDQW